MNRWAAELMTEVLTQSFVKSKNEKTQLTLAYSSKVAFNWGKLRETRMILNLKLKHFTISSMQDKYINAWLRTSFFNDSIVFTLIKLTLIRLFPIWLPLLGTAPTYKLKKRIFDNSKLNMREDAFQSIAQCLAATFPYLMAFARKWISPVYFKAQVWPRGQITCWPPGRSNHQLTSL